jgi:uncharacterized protein YxjI
MMSAMDLQAHSRFLLAQKLTMLVNRYQYFAYDQGLKGEQVAFVEQKRFAFREHMTVYSDDSRSTTLFTVIAEKLLDVHGRFMVRDANDVVIGYCRKSFGASLLRSTWQIFDAEDQLLFTAVEQHHAIAILRRVLQFVPAIGEFAAIIPFNFVFQKDGVIVGGHRRVWGSWTDQYSVEVTTAADRRLVLALGILLDALQDR